MIAWFWFLIPFTAAALVITPNLNIFTALGFSVVGMIFIFLQGWISKEVWKSGTFSKNLVTAFKFLLTIAGLFSCLVMVLHGINIWPNWDWNLRSDDISGRGPGIIFFIILISKLPLTLILLFGLFLVLGLCQVPGFIRGYSAYKKNSQEFDQIQGKLFDE
tara:strand:+ start:201 stop:683 length:483 start_codon:yes stop_codon:yes gene_type:complete